jgi:hypothetical protein
MTISNRLGPLTIKDFEEIDLASEEVDEANEIAEDAYQIYKDECIRELQNNY